MCYFLEYLFSFPNSLAWAFCRGYRHISPIMGLINLLNKIYSFFLSMEKKESLGGA